MYLGCLASSPRAAPKLGDDTGQRALGDELDGPDGIDDLPSRHQIARSSGKTHQHVHHFEFDLDGLVTSVSAG